MKSLGVSAAASDAEALRQSLKAPGLLRDDLRVRRDAGRVTFPVRSFPANLPSGATTGEWEFEAQAAEASGGYRRLVDIDAELRGSLPRSFDVVGDIVLVRIPRDLEPHSRAIGRALLEFVPGARVVGWDRGVRGEDRIRDLERIAGEGEFRTRYRENGLLLEVDLARAYFSPRLAGEHARFAAQVRTGETVLDLCCGVGPFALAVARAGRAARVTAVDQNPAAIALLSSSLRRLGSPTPVEVECAPLATFLGTARVSDRVVFNLPHEGIKYLPQVFPLVAPAGALQYYEVTERAERSGRAQELLHRAPDPRAWEAEEARPVHPYSPTSDLVAFALRRRG